MGCDIHFYTETKQANGSWKLHGNIVKDEQDDPESWASCDTSLYDGRNYDLFAILANVRNGCGFAGVKTGEGFNPISEPRGIPADASSEYKQFAEQWGGDGHSHQHLTLRELLDYDWTQEIGMQGWVGLKEWLNWSRYNRVQGLGPALYSGGVRGQDVVHLSADEIDALAKEFYDLDRDAREAFLTKHASTYGMAEWGVPYYRAAGSFLDETVPQLLKLAGGTSGLDNVRIVFFFDN